MTWLSGWSHRKAHTLTGSTAGAQTNYQVGFKVYYGSGSDGTLAIGSATFGQVYCNNKCNPDFSDIRFALEDSTLLDYWIESQTNGDNAVVWVEVDSIPANLDTKTIYVYYGKSDATSASNGYATFPVFANFDAGTLDGFTVTDGSVDNPSTYLRSAGVYEADGRKGGVYADYSITFKVQGASSPNELGVLGRWDGTGANVGDTYLWRILNDSTWELQKHIGGNWTQLASGSGSYSSGTWYKLELYMVGTTLNGYINDVVKASSITDSARSSGYSGFRSYENGYQYWDDFRIRPLVSPEPTHTSWGTEEAGTIIVPYDGRYAGQGSKQTILQCEGENTTIMQVESNVPDHLDSSAIIENLIIDGQYQSGTTGILLQNVYNCCIRNITIKNCDVGIKVELTGTNWSHANRFEHIRMENVKTGILFEGTSTNKDFSYTIIDDVGIQLKYDSSAVGIKIGDPYANLYNAFIKATVWLADNNGYAAGTGMIVNGELKLSLVNLEVEEPRLNGVLQDGKGLVVNQNAYANDNQSFLLATGGIKTANVRQNNGGTVDPAPGEQGYNGVYLPHSWD